MKSVPVAVLLAVVLAGCGSSADGSATSAITGEATQADMAQARREHDAAIERWDQAALTDYTLAVFLGHLAEVEIMVTGGSVGEQRIVTDDNGAAAQLPRSVETLFAETDAIIRALENDPSRLPAATDETTCDGHFFSIRYELDTGLPAGYDTFSPCEDGIGIAAELR